MFESLEDRQFMSVSLVNTSTTSITDGTSNTVMVGERFCKTDKGTPETYLTINMENVLISGYQ